MAESFPSRPEPPLTIAVSECLLGAAVRYDGTDSKSEFPHKALDGLFRYRGICPEVGIGLGIPRAPIRLEMRDGSVRVAGVNAPNVDVTDRLVAFARHKAAELNDVFGYVFMKNSPSCGLLGVKIFRSETVGRGVYAQTILEQCPNLPVEENGRLSDPRFQECFVARVFAYAHWQALQEIGLTVAGLREFQERYACLLMAHSIEHYERAEVIHGNLNDNLQNSADAYLGLLMAGLSQPAGREGHAAVLATLLSSMKQHHDRDSCRELEQLITGYTRGDETLEAVLVAIKSHTHEQPDPYVERQVYLQPMS